MLFLNLFSLEGRSPFSDIIFSFYMLYDPLDYYSNLLYMVPNSPEVVFWLMIVLGPFHT